MTCKLCYRKGHTKKKCPQSEEEIERMDEDEKDLLRKRKATWKLERKEKKKDSNNRYKKRRNW